MAASTVRRRGTDTSNRGIYATDYMWDWWENQILADPRVAPFAAKIVITQGAWQTENPGGGAADSKGYHDGGGTFDLRVWNLTATEVAILVLVLREKAAAAYLRNLQHGGFEDPHIHFVLGSDFGLSAGAKQQWAAYLAGRDGLASNGPDYHPRPRPLVTQPPEDDMFSDADRATLNDLKADFETFRKNLAARDRAFRKAVVGRLDTLADEVKDDATKAQIQRVRADIAALAEEPDPS